MTTIETATELVLTERHDGVLTITINRPAQRNAVNREVAVQVASALDLLDSDPSLSVGVLTGAGGTFSAGMDLKAFANGQTPILPGRGFGGVTQAVVRKPLDRGRRRMGARRWLRDGAGLRPDRRRRRR